MDGRALRRTGLVVALALFGGGCAGQSAGSPSSVSSPADASASPTAVSSSPTAVPTKVAEPTFAIRYEAGRVTGDTGRLKVKFGTKVVIRISSDAADEVHLHGYDVSVKVAAGGTALLAFTARIRGVFEIELEKLGKQLAKVQVQ